MKMRPLGKSGIEASVVALGTWGIGGWMWGGADDEQSIRALHAALDEGINLIDTAPIYGFGHSEEVVGRAIRDRRDQVVLATKCGMVVNTTQGQFKARSTGLGISEHGHIRIQLYNHPDSIREEVELSLKRLQTDYIDLYQTHWQEETTPIEDTMAALLDLKQQGKIRAIGVCNASSEQMARYAAVGQLDADQEKYSLLDRDIEQDQLPYCYERQMAVLAYSPLALGLLTGKIGPEVEFGAGDVRAKHPRFSKSNRQMVAAFLKATQPVADKHGLTIAQLVIAWTVHQPGLTHALCGARNPNNAKENAAAGRATLSEDDLQTLDAILARHAAEMI